MARAADCVGYIPEAMLLWRQAAVVFIVRVCQGNIATGAGEAHVSAGVPTHVQSQLVLTLLLGHCGAAVSRADTPPALHMVTTAINLVITMIMCSLLSTCC